MHMLDEDLMVEFDFKNLSFIDLGLSLLNDSEQTKFSFVKVVDTPHSGNTSRDVYLMALNTESLPRWENCLKI